MSTEAAVERHRVTMPVGTVSLVLHRPSAVDPPPCIVACHGLRASKDSDKYLQLAEACTRAGLALARFDFRGSGESDGVHEADTTVASRVEDALAVVAFVRAHAHLDGRVGLLGSSMGGFVALHARRALADRVPVVTWNAPASLAKLAASVSFEDTGLGLPFLAEFAAGSYASAPAGIDHHLVIQSEADETVSSDHGVALHGQAGEPRRLLVLPAADHRITDPAHRREAVAHTVAWFRRHLTVRSAPPTRPSA
jgi:dipeptidyl aminopeptidase/acylaminoacyl peptidase